ncbi:MAG TPA: hypothetical protein VGK89_11730 [Candidatus Eisenbacteria bacterium]
MTRPTFFVALLLLALAAGGCALVGGSPPERYGGSATLSGAARAAADSTQKPKRKRPDVGDQVPTYSGGEGTVTVETDELDSSSRSPDSGSGDLAPVIGIVTGGGSLGGHEFEGFGLGGLDLGAFVGERWRLDLGLLVLSPNLSATSLAGQGLKDELELAADLSARYYLTPPHTFLGVYPLVGMRFGTLFWNFRKPVNVIADGHPKTIEDDYLDYFAIYGGAGLSLIQSRHFHSGLNLTSGVRAYGDKTFEGFRNDLFPATGYTQLAFEVTYRF